MSQKKSKPSIIRNPNWEKWQIMKNKPWNRETMLTAALACLQAPAMNPVTCVMVCIGVWWGGGLGKRKQSCEGDFLIWSDQFL